MPSNHNMEVLSEADMPTASDIPTQYPLHFVQLARITILGCQGNQALKPQQGGTSPLQQLPWAIRDTPIALDTPHNTLRTSYMQEQTYTTPSAHTSYARLKT